MTKTTGVCPRCFSSDLRIVGCFIHDNDGVPFKTDFSHKDFDQSNVFESQILTRCSMCHTYAPLADVQDAGTLAQEAVRWEKSIDNKKIPLICPICKNKEQFIQERLVLVEQTVSVQVDAEGVWTETDLLNDASRSHVTLAYRCALEDCQGVITINPDTFTVTPL